jgi:hypothetical protein
LRSMRAPRVTNYHKCVAGRGWIAPDNS